MEMGRGMGVISSEIGGREGGLVARRRELIRIKEMIDKIKLKERSP